MDFEELRLLLMKNSQEEKPTHKKILSSDKQTQQRQVANNQSGLSHWIGTR